MIAERNTIVVTVDRLARHDAKRLVMSIRFVLLAAGAVGLENSCAAGMIFSVAPLSHQGVSLWAADAPQKFEIESVGAVDDLDAAPDFSRLRLDRLALGDTFAETSGCGAPLPVSGVGFAGALAAAVGAASELNSALELTGRLTTELKLTVPVIAPFELLDPPRERTAP